jgi:hypothetical protein
MVDPQPFDLAERVAKIARSLEIETALIGASALAVHGYVRATSDIDFASAADPFVDLPRLQEALEQEGLRTKLNLPDSDDPLGGLLRAWLKEDDDGDPINPIEIVNFCNPQRPVRLPMEEIIRDAIQLADKPALRYVRLPHLILLKMYAGNLRDHADVVTLLEKNPDADLEEIRSLCTRCGLEGIDGLIARSKSEKPRAR